MGAVQVSGAGVEKIVIKQEFTAQIPGPAYAEPYLTDTDHRIAAKVIRAAQIVWHRDAVVVFTHDRGNIVIAIPQIDSVPDAFWTTLNESDKNVTVRPWKLYRAFFIDVGWHMGPFWKATTEVPGRSSQIQEPPNARGERN